MLIAVLVFASLCLCAPRKSTLKDNPVANPNATIYVGNARFTLLTPQLIRIEYSASRVFEDRASLAILNRRLPVPAYSRRTANGCTQITTAALSLTYCPGLDNSQGFTASSLLITGLTTSFNWNPTSFNYGNLLGTIRTLEGNNTARAHHINCSQPLTGEEAPYCTMALISTQGWSLVNDSATNLFDGSSDWDWVVQRPVPLNTDWYFFGHGLDYKRALYDFTQIAGKVPLVPRYSLGIYWSRYWAFSAIGEQEIVQEYITHQTPLDVLVVDMDWHETFYKEAAKGILDQAGQRIGWTGYTWDKHLFPDPTNFIDWVHTMNLKLTLNMHPASGVQPHEDRYPEMARSMGIDPSSNKYVPLNFTSKKYFQNWFDLVLDYVGPLDFWWLDWQQEHYTNMANLNPTFWLNYIFTSRFKATQSTQRPLILHRWGGLGNHRYQLGFSGDTTPTWEALTFQPYFTATAANVGFMWSHDLGGHTEPSPPEMYTRWVQFGLWSPVFRTHCTKQPENDRRIWVYPFDNFQIMRDAMTLRSRLVPYIYHQARIAHDTGLIITHPLYYEYPSLSDAYKLKNEYFFGQNIIVHPVTQPVDNATQLAQQQIWIPPGTWIEWGSLQRYTGPTFITRSYTLAEMPVFVPSGTVIPMLPVFKPLLGSAANQYNALHFNIFVSYNSGTTTTTQGTLYEDEGDSDADQTDDDRHAWLPYTLTDSQSSAVFVVSPINGSYNNMPLYRNYYFAFVGLLVNGTNARVTVNGSPVQYVDKDVDAPGWSYDSAELTLTVNTYSNSVQAPIIIKVEKSVPAAIKTIAGAPRCLKRFDRIVTLLDNNFPQIFQEDYQAVLDIKALATSPATTANLGALPTLLVNALTQIKALNVSQHVITSAFALAQGCLAP